MVYFSFLFLLLCATQKSFSVFCCRDLVAQAMPVYPVLHRRAWMGNRSAAKDVIEYAVCLQLLDRYLSPARSVNNNDVPVASVVLDTVIPSCVHYRSGSGFYC